MVKFTASTVLVLLALAATAEAASKQTMEPNDVSSTTAHKKKGYNRHGHNHKKVNLRRRSRELKNEDGKGKNSKKDESKEDSKKKDSDDKSAGGNDPQNNAGGKDKKETIGNYAGGGGGGGGGDKKGGSGGGGGGGDKKGGSGGGGGDKKKNEMPIINFADGGIRPSSGTWRPGVYSNNGGTSFGLGGQPQGQPVITNMAGQPSGVLGQTPNKQEFYNPNAPGGVDTVPTNMAARPFTGNINPPAGVVPGQAYTTVHIVNTANNPKPSAANQAATSAALANMQNNGGTAVTSSPPKTPVISNNAAMEVVDVATPTVVTTPAVVTNPQTQPLQVSGGTTSTTPVAPVKPMPTVSLDPSLYPANWDIAPTTCVKANKEDWLWKNKSGDGRFDVQQMYARVPQCMYDDHCATGCCVRFHSGFKICQNPDTMSDQMLKWCSGTCSASASVNREDNV